MKINLGTIIKTFSGVEVPIYFPTQEQLDKALDSEKRLDVSKLPRETVKDILLTVLESCEAEDRKTIFLVHNVGQLIIGGGVIELSEIQTEFLGKILEKAVLSQVGDKQKGIYPAWKIAQVLDLIGVKE